MLWKQFLPFPKCRAVCVNFMCVKLSVPCLAPLTRSNSQPEEVIKAELLCYRCPYRFDPRSASLVFLDRGILSFAFHQVLSPGAVPLDLRESREFHVVVLMVFMVLMAPLHR